MSLMFYTPSFTPGHLPRVVRLLPDGDPRAPGLDIGKQYGVPVGTRRALLLLRETRVGWACPGRES
jgi:hypothetical protein